MASDSKRNNESTITTLKKFVRVCVKRGKTLEEARDALLVANLDRDLVESALEATVFDRTTEGHISLDFSRLKGPTASFAPEKKKATPKARPQPVIEKVELATSPFFRRGQARRKPSLQVVGRPETFGARLFQGTFRWGFVAAALFGLIFAGWRPGTSSARRDATQVTQHSRTQFTSPGVPSTARIDPQRRAPSRGLANTARQIRLSKTRHR